MHRVRFAKGVENDLRRIRADHRSLILEGIQEMLTREPTVETRNRKQLVNLVPPFEAIPPSVGVSDSGVPSVLRRLGGREGRVRSRGATEAGASLNRGDSMKTVTVRDLQKSVRECVDIAQDDRVVITRHGRPAAVLVGIEGEEWEDVVLQTSASFWRLIEKRRQEPTISIEQMKARFAKPRRKRRA